MNLLRGRRVDASTLITRSTHELLLARTEDEARALAESLVRVGAGVVSLAMAVIPSALGAVAGDAGARMVGLGGGWHGLGRARGRGHGLPVGGEHLGLGAGHRGDLGGRIGRLAADRRFLRDVDGKNLA